jgi:hypothetical protein
VDDGDVRDDRSTTPGSPPAAEPAEPQAQRSEVGLATITLRQIRVSRADVPDKPQDKLHDRSSSTDANPMNRLVPYLDLYARLSDEELARLAGVPASVASNLRRQVVQVDRALARFTDLLPRLTDAELVRLTGATPKTIRFWRLCQPRLPMTGPEGQGSSVAQAAETLGRVQSSAELPRRSGSSPSTGTYQAALGESPPLDSGAPLGHAATERYAGRPPSDPPSGTYRMTAAEREAYRPSTTERDGSSAYRLPTAEREAYRRAADGGSFGGAPASRTPSGSLAPVDLSRPRTGRTEELPAAERSSAPGPSPAARPPDVVQKQQAVAQQMAFSGAPFPGYDSESSGPVDAEDGIFIGLELPDPRSVTPHGRRE